MIATLAVKKKGGGGRGPKYTTFLKTQNYTDSKITGCQGLMWVVEANRWSRKDF